MMNAMRAASERIVRLDAMLAEIVPDWSMAPLVAAYQALRGVGFANAVTIAAETGDLRRFEHPRELMAYLGLVPTERSTGETRRHGGITKTGNRRARTALIEASWTYRYPAGIGEAHQHRQAALPEPVREIAWKAQARLCSRYRKLTSRGKRATVAATAIARELAAFLWSIAQRVTPACAGNAA